MTKSEAARIRERYAHVRSFEERMSHTGFRRMLAERDEALKNLLLGPTLPKPLRQCRILDFGCGDGYIMNFLHHRGASPELIFGCDIQSECLVKARSLYPNLQFFETDGTKLPFADGEIDLITCCTVFSSIIDPDLQAHVAQELTRVLAKTGSVIWYDMRMPSPGNRAMPMAHIRKLFPQLMPKLESMTLLPPLAESLGPLTDTLYPALALMPPLRSHYFGTLCKTGVTMQNKLADSISQFNQRTGPRIGDYVITGDGVYRRIACDWGMELQTGTNGSFHLSDRTEGHMNFCGHLDLVIPRNKIIATDKIMPGTCEFQEQAVTVDYKVWRAEGAYRIKFRSPPLKHPMVIELIGVSGVGKTTIAAALTNRLQQKGYTVYTVSGKRDRLLSRSLTRGFQTLWSWSPGRSPLTSSLMKLLPPRNPLWAIRLRGYCSQLLGQATNGFDIVILDQGWVQFVCSLALLSGIDDPRRIAEALKQIPKPDFVVRIDAPLDTIETRVRQRYQRLGTVQRWLEPDLTASSQVKVVEAISDILSNNGQRFLELDCSDKETSVLAVEKALSEMEPYQWT